MSALNKSNWQQKETSDELINNSDSVGDDSPSTSAQSKMTACPSGTSSSARSSIGPTSKGSFICPVVSCNAAFRAIGFLKNHYRSHTGLRPYRCRFESCALTTTTRGNLTVHIRTAHFKLPLTVKKQNALGIEDDRDPNLYIETLQYLLDKEHEELAHLLSATSSANNAAASNIDVIESQLSEDSVSSDTDSERSFEATKCKTIKRKSVGRYVCRFDNCDKTFRSVNNLKDHDRIHRKIQPYRCKYSNSCSYESSSKSNVITHIRVLHLDLPRTIREQKEQGIEDDRDAAIHLETIQELLDEEDELFQSLGIFSCRKKAQSKLQQKKAVTTRDSENYDTERNSLFRCKMCNTKIMGQLQALSHVRTIHFKVQRNEQNSLGDLANDPAYKNIEKCDSNQESENDIDSEGLGDIDFDYLDLTDGDGEDEEEVGQSTNDNAGEPENDELIEADNVESEHAMLDNELNIRPESDLSSNENIELEMNQKKDIALDNFDSADYVEYYESCTSDYSNDTIEDEPTLFYCTKPGCDASFRSVEEMKNHKQSHSGITFRCNYNSDSCQFESPDKSKVIRHIRLIHFHLPPKVREQRKLGIKDDRDAKQFLEEQKHLLTHDHATDNVEELANLKAAYRSELKQYDCSFAALTNCEFKFTSRKKLQRHERNHLSIASFHCNCRADCGYRHDKWGKVFKHVREVHLELPRTIEDDEYNADNDQGRQYVRVVEDLLDY